MACPYFLPTAPLPGELWPHRHRLPLGDGWRGRCTVTNGEPSENALKEFCNLGYAKGCPYLPANRTADAVRLGVRDRDGRVCVFYVCELDHRPVESGTLQFDPAAGRWITSHHDACIQRMAECVLAARCQKARKF